MCHLNEDSQGITILQQVMCEGNSDGTVATRGKTSMRRVGRRRRAVSRRLRDDTASIDERSAWDRPPPIASPLDIWRPRKMQSQTPQHLVTLSIRANNRTTATHAWSAPPLLLRDRFLAAPTAAGSIFIWDLVRILCPSHELENCGGSVISSPLHTQRGGEEAEASHPASVATAATATTAATSEPDSYSDYYAHAVYGNSSTLGALPPFGVPTVTDPDLVVDVKPMAAWGEIITAEDGSPIPCSLVALTSAPDRSCLLDKNDDNGQCPVLLVGLSVAGFVHVVALEEDLVKTSSIGDPSLSPLPSHNTTKLRIKFQYSWSTGSVGGMQCVTVTREGLVVIGYDSGRLEAWKLKPETIDMRTDKKPPPTATTGKTSPGKKSVSGGGGDAAAAEPGKVEDSVQDHHVVYKEQLVWRASFEFAPSIRSVVELDVQQNESLLSSSKLRCSDEESLPSPRGDGDAPAPHEKGPYLLLTVQQETRTSTGSMIEVVNVANLVQEWKKAHTDEEINPLAHSASLDNHCILPQPGMEIVNSITLPSHDGRSGNELPRPTWLPSRGTDCLCPITCSTSVSCAVALADGSVLLLSTSNPLDGQLAWGIQHPEHQLLLSHPAVGIGVLSCTAVNASEHSERRRIPHLVCCLRGGTAYLIPVTQQQSTNPPVVSVVSYPHDIESNIDFHRIQHFAAGNVMIERSDGSIGHDSIPVLLYAWPGGIIDVYAAELIPDVREDPLLQELVSNGSVELLRNHLASLETVAPEWTATRKEVRSWPHVGPISVRALMSRSFESFRHTLLSLVDGESS